MLVLYAFLPFGLITHLRFGRSRFLARCSIDYADDALPYWRRLGSVVTLILTYAAYGRSAAAVGLHYRRTPRLNMFTPPPPPFALHLTPLYRLLVLV